MRRSSNNEAEVVQWIEQIVLCQRGEQPVGEWLKSGVLLCNLVNNIRPGLVRTVNQQAAPFKQMENIRNFLHAARELGLEESSMFDTIDLYEEKNLDSVIKCIYALGGAVQTHCPDFTGPKLGIPVFTKGKDPSKSKPKPAAHLLHLDPAEVGAMRMELESLRERVAPLQETHDRLLRENESLRQRAEVDVPHWASQVRQLAEQLEEVSAPLASVPIGEKLMTVFQGLQVVEGGLRGMKGAPLREEMDELKRAFAQHLGEGERREEALRQEVQRLRAQIGPGADSPNSVL
eukprot:TRINITY_DN108969_c0_g1_i1.p1 TRINITY_DN108969_c0_g1~~TRINITY_DN108969_c0_g1_i1.p1  ORF type:complete len:290 (-),score=61.93 TRINITY_DN108969_c0_g1_i1:267-1136(-)